ncbi:MAG: hypothetical protein ABIT20_13375 [Gemmatimonadaceae bacterium]
MSQTSPGDRRYDRREVDLILRTASQMDPLPAATQQHDHDDLTLAEIQDIGSQAGIDRNDIATATLTVAVESARHDRRRLHHVHVVDGELREDAWNVLVDNLRSAVEISVVSRSTGALEVEMDDPNGEIGRMRLGIRSTNGSTTISIWSDAPHRSTIQILSLGLLGISVTLFPVVASAGGQWPSVGVVAALGAAGVAIGSGVAVGWRRWATARWQKRVTSVMTSIVTQVTRSVSTERLPQPNREGAPEA